MAKTIAVVNQKGGVGKTATTMNLGAGLSREGYDVLLVDLDAQANLTMAAGSYHAGYDAVEDLANARILGVTYPVYVEDPAVLAGFTEITDEDTAEIDVAQGRSGIVKTEVSGKDLLFASGDYAYYVLKEEPTNYKRVEVSEEGLSFSAVRNGAEKAEGLEVKPVYTDHHVDVVLQLTDSENLTDDITVCRIRKNSMNNPKSPARKQVTHARLRLF